MSTTAVLPSSRDFPGTTTVEGWQLIGCLPPERALHTIAISSPTFVIGRHPSSSLVIKSQCVSGRHAELLQVANHLFVRDLGSTNGTYLNRKRVLQPSPVAPGDHIEIANVEFRVEYQEARPPIPSPWLELQKKTTQAIDVIHSDWILSQFEELMRTEGITPYFQPIVSLESADVIGVEALARSPLPGLEKPVDLFHTAHLCQREVDLSLLCRKRAVEAADWVGPDQMVFVNTHPLESIDVDLIPSISRLKQDYPRTELVVEIHEGSVKDPNRMAHCINQLRDAGVKIAYDDFGSGQSRLLELVKSPPDFLKFDRCLIHDIHEADLYQWRILQLLVDCCRERGIVTIAEGIEVAAEVAACREIGFDLGQGYFLGRPEPGPPVAPKSMAANPDCSSTMRLKRSPL